MPQLLTLPLAAGALTGAVLSRVGREGSHPGLRLLAGAALAVTTLAAGPAGAQDSPLQVVMDGRAAAGTSNLTESGMRDLAQSGANIVLYVFGAVAIALTALGLIELYQASDGDLVMGGQQATKARAIWKLVVAGLVSIPAVVAAILPYAVL